MRKLALGMALVAGCVGGNDGHPRVLVSVSAGDRVEHYDLFVRSDDPRAVILHTGWSDATFGGTKSTATAPIKLGLTLPRNGSYSIAVVGAIGPVQSSRPFLGAGARQFYSATTIQVNGDTMASLDLLEVRAGFDGDGDLFPSTMWPKDQPMAAAIPTALLDCNDAAPSINPFAQEICGDGIDQDCDGTDEPCADRDNDGDPDATDCAPDDPTRHHPITDPKSPHYDPAPQSANCCGYALRQMDKTKDYTGNKICHPGTCNDGIDQDCSGSDVACINDKDCDTFPASDKMVSSCMAPPNKPAGNDCNDCDPKVNPGAQEVCDGIDNNCNGLTDEGCVGCDLDGDGFQRMDPMSGCPDKNNGNRPIDCDDEDAGVFPGSTDAMHPVAVPYLAGALGNCGGAEGGSAACALRGACRNK